MSWILTVSHLMVRLQSWNFGECWVPVHCHYSQIYSVLNWLYLLGFLLWIKLNYLNVCQTWKHWTMCKKMSFVLFKNVTYKIFANISHTHTYTHTYIYIYMCVCVCVCVCVCGWVCAMRKIGGRSVVNISVYLLFYLFFSPCQIYQNQPFISLCMYVWVNRIWY